MDKALLKSIWDSRHAFWSLSLMQLKGRYAASVLGIFWAVVNPLLIMAAISFVFTQVFKARLENFSFFVLSGIIPWMFFSNAVSEAAASVLNRQAMTRQYNLPVVIFPLASLMANFLNFLIGWAVLYPVFLFFNPKVIGLCWLLPLIFVLLLCLTTGFCLALSVLNILFRDIEHLLSVILMFWFWVTPVFYAIDMVPAQFLWVYRLNPLMPYIVFYQKVVFEGVMPAPVVFIQVLLYAAASLSSGLAIFMKLEPGILKKI